jgi:hypothetical protein
MFKVCFLYDKKFLTIFIEEDSMRITLGAQIVTRIVGDGYLKSIETASQRKGYFHGRRRAPSFDAQCDKRKKVIPPQTRVYWFLIGLYKSRQKRAKSSAKYLEYAALITAAKVMWEMTFSELCEKIKIKEKSREEIIITDDWHICVRRAIG